jgi:hypothetical protein
VDSVGASVAVTSSAFSSSFTSVVSDMLKKNNKELSPG